MVSEHSYAHPVGEACSPGPDLPLLRLGLRSPDTVESEGPRLSPGTPGLSPSLTFGDPHSPDIPPHSCLSLRQTITSQSRPQRPLRHRDMPRQCHVSPQFKCLCPAAARAVDQQPLEAGRAWTLNLAARPAFPKVRSLPGHTSTLHRRAGTCSPRAGRPQGFPAGGRHPGARHMSFSQ